MGKLINMRAPVNYNSTPTPLVLVPKYPYIRLGVDLKNEQANWEEATRELENKWIPKFTPKNARSHTVESTFSHPYGAYLTTYHFNVYFYR